MSFNLEPHKTHPALTVALILLACVVAFIVGALVAGDPVEVPSATARWV